ncbi:hypothetical protein WA026_017618 [Henosepilachna vigintioctopunctata]|uniref:Bifunctional glutamate/proline--tRNA ligase n=1 Tax=Henosepilachna vigintioctopunctata TaxID=420089 RepID=A0AAW1V0N8_9CUCU
MTIKLICKKSNPPLGGILAANCINFTKNNQVEIQWAEENYVEHSSQRIDCDTTPDILRAISRFCQSNLYGGTPLEKTQIDHWLCYTLGPLSLKNEFSSALTHLNNILGPITFLVGKQLTIADFAIFASLYANKQWQDLLSKSAAPDNVLRWYKFIESLEYVKKVINNLTPEIQQALKKSAEENSVDTASVTATGRAREGKFIDLPGAKMGEVVVRFPPEASGYLHIGHAKAALLNQYYQQAFKGKLVMRFDDTNPAKENVHFEKVILDDIAMLDIKPDMFTYTSDYFELMLEYCEKMLKQGIAYADDTDPEIMKQEREQKLESANRNNDVAKNFKLWEEMKKGTDVGQKCCIRAKIDMKSLNGCLRDPTIYRCKNEAHPRTGTKYKVYPTYDFACPIVDAIEGVTHTLRTMEYHDRDPQFYWFIDVLGLRKPYIWEYSRLSMTNTVLSKRKLTWFVEQGLVDGWDDPRMPTVRGVLRRGMTVEGLKEFIIAQGSSRSVVFMEWDKIWAFNKKVIDPIAPRYTVVDYDTHVPVIVKGAKEECLTVPKHPKNPDVGTKSVWIGPKILIDKADVEVLKEGQNATFINWGNLMIKKINKKGGNVESVEAELNLDNKDYKKTPKVTFLCETEKAKFTPTFCIYFDHIISKPLLGKDEDFKQFIGHETRKDLQVLGDPELRNLKQGDIIQIQRRGFFRVDVPYGERSPFTCKEQPVILFYVPDGSAKENPFFKASSVTNDTPVKKEEKSSAKTESSPSKVTLSSANKTALEINEEIIKQGNIVRDLKAKKATKADIDIAVKSLLAVKAEYLKLTGCEWKPGCTPPNVNSATDVSIDSSDELNRKIIAQGDKVRQLKAQKADKAQVEVEVKALLSLKAEFKTTTGKDWSPSTVNTAPQVPVQDESIILKKIAAQGDKVRELKSKKASKPEIDAEVKTLLTLKEEFKKLTGKAWTAEANSSDKKTSEKTISSKPSGENDLLSKISEQGDKVRKLKSEKAEKAKIDAEVKILLELKKEFKNVTGKDWKPDMKPTVVQNTVVKENVAVNSSGDAINASDLTKKINDQGNLVRDLKSKKAKKEEIDKAVTILLSLKSQYKQLTGTDFPVSGRPSSDKTTKAPKEKKENKPKQEPKEKKAAGNEDSNVKKQTRLGLEAKKEEDLPNWYSQVITKGEMIEYYDVSGCYIYRPWSYSIWEVIKGWLDEEIKKLGVQNCYFPIFVSKAMLEKEKSHIADFSPEVAWVTKSGDSEMSEPIAVRPTSETVMYPAYAKWIQSYRDLPIKLNQWNNVVRWEFKHPQPFLRTREFLWQEGHTAFATFEEAKEEVELILDLYAKVYTDLLAIPVIKGRKTEKEKFAGGTYTYTVEAYISASGRAIQGATSHHLGQNFSKMFDIIYEDPETQEKKYVYQNSWGITTRTIGVMIMVHSDNQGLVLPPYVASVQVIIVPCGITTSLSEEDRKKLENTCSCLESELKQAGIRSKGDHRSNYSPGWKFNHWELKGVPIRVELGPKDVEKDQLIAVRRDTGEKLTIPLKEATTSLKKLLQEIHNNLYSKASDDLMKHVVTFKEWAEFVPNLEKKNLNLVPFCGDKDCEETIKIDSTRDDGNADAAGPSSGAKSLCIPLDQPTTIEASDKCIHPKCNKKPQYYTLFGRSY